MSHLPTPHIDALYKEDFAPTVLMPGDPLRAQFIAENFLEQPRLISKTRGILAYTGSYRNQPISVMASGMGMASIGIYAYELFHFYDVACILRIGSCGAYDSKLNVKDIFLATEAWSESTFAAVQSGYKETVMMADDIFSKQILQGATAQNIPLATGRVHCTDVFYREDTQAFLHIEKEHQCRVVEMETFALYATARSLGKQATALLTVSDHLRTQEKLSAEERQIGFGKMIRLALDSCTFR